MDSVESGATPATTAPDDTPERCAAHEWRDLHWTKEIELAYWSVPFVLGFSSPQFLSFKVFCFYFLCVVRFFTLG